MILEAIILAAGDGTRMRSDTPKSLHRVGGRAMVSHVIAAVNALSPAKIHVVIGAQAEGIRDAVTRDLSHDEKANAAINWVTQNAALGTGHAALQAMPAVDDDATVLLLYADAPLISAQTLRELITAAAAKNRLALLTAERENPTGLGRIVRDADDKIIGIVEEKDADAAQKKIRECNTGFIAGDAKNIAAALEN